MEQPKIPTLKETQKPQVKIRGLEASATLFDRLKQFKKKDLAFILAGLGTLFMAPLAEHFMMSPDGGDATLSQGFGGKGGARTPGGFGGGSSPYEPGTNGMAPGGAIGGGSDVITPLNVRDPSALVMGPGATQQPPTSSVAPQTPPPTAPTRSDSELKDALAASARGVGSALKKALLPMPKIALNAGSLRGLGAVGGGGSSASASLAPVSSNGLVTGKANAGGGLTNVRPRSDYKGVARGPGQGGSGIEALKKAADGAGERMNQGAASSALNDAANAGIPLGGNAAGGNGAGSSAPADKGFGGNQDHNSKSVGESLDFLKRKMDQEKAQELYWKKKEANDYELLWANMRNDAMKSMVSDGLAKPIAGFMGDSLKGIFKGPSSHAKMWTDCHERGSGTKVPDIAWEDTSGTDADKCTTTYRRQSTSQFSYCSGSTAIIECNGIVYSKSGDTPSKDGAALGVPEAQAGQSAAHSLGPEVEKIYGGEGDQFGEFCSLVDGILQAPKIQPMLDHPGFFQSMRAALPGQTSGKTYLNNLKALAAQAETAYLSLGGEAVGKKCEGVAKQGSIKEDIKTISLYGSVDNYCTDGACIGVAYKRLKGDKNGSASWKKGGADSGWATADAKWNSSAQEIGRDLGLLKEHSGVVSNIAEAVAHAAAAPVSLLREKKQEEQQFDASVRSFMDNVHSEHSFQTSCNNSRCDENAQYLSQLNGVLAGLQAKVTDKERGLVSAHAQSRALLDQLKPIAQADDQSPNGASTLERIFAIAPPSVPATTSAAKPGAAQPGAGAEKQPASAYQKMVDEQIHVLDDINANVWTPVDKALQSASAPAAAPTSADTSKSDLGVSGATGNLNNLRQYILAAEKEAAERKPASVDVSQRQSPKEFNK